LFLTDGTHILSESGVQQGDPLGPLLFALVLDILTVKIKANVPELNLNGWYLDDGCLVGPTEAVFKAYELIEKTSPELGLTLNANKCALHWPIDQEGWNLFPKIMPRLTNGTCLLGAPIGNQQFCETFGAKIVENAVELLFKIQELEDPQLELKLVQTCLGYSKICYGITGVTFFSTPKILLNLPLLSSICVNDL